MVHNVVHQRFYTKKDGNTSGKFSQGNKLNLK